MPDYATDESRTLVDLSQRRSVAADHYDVVLLHHDEVMRHGLQTMLAALPDVGRVASVPGAADLLELMSERRPDVAILSSSIEPHVGQVLLDATSRYGIKVLLLLRSSDRSAVLRASSLSVDGFLLEAGLTAAGLLVALRALRDGGMPVPPSLVRELLSAVKTGGKVDRLRQLTPRERSTLVLMVDGLSNKQIARRLGISEHGAKRHVANVLAKLNCPNRTLAAAVAIREGLVEGR